MPRTRTTRATTSTEPYPEPGLLLDIEVDPTGFNRQKAERRHPCSECSKAFTTSGHLARHMKTHTGERAHKCPFPGCNTTCSRQDNLQQHYRVHLSPTSKRASNAENRAAIARARAAPGSRRRLTRNSQEEDTSPVTVSQYNQAPEPPSPPSSPPPLGEAHPDILTGRRPANPLPSGEQPVPIFVSPTPEQAMRLGLPMPMPHVPGSAPPPQAWIRAPSGALVPYDERRPYEALGYTNFQPYASRAPTQVSPEDQRSTWSVPPPSTSATASSSSSSSSMMSGSSSSTASMTLSPSYSTSTKRMSPPRAVYNPPQHLPSPPRTGCGRPGFEREVLEKQAQQARTQPAHMYTEPLHGHPYMSAPPPTASSSISSTSTLSTHYAAAPQPFAHHPAPPPRPLQQETTLERFARMAESLPPPPPSRGAEDPFRQPPGFGAARGPALPPLRFREDSIVDSGLKLPPLGAPPMQTTWPGHGLHVR